MSVRAVHIGNFKGIDKPRWVELRPLTVFVGPNSSGKSTCLHALACLSQTIKLPNNRRPLSLDDEYASVHLGRFIEVAHGRTYADAISLGVRVPDATYPVLGKNSSTKHMELKAGELTATYCFKSTDETQAVYLESGVLELPGRKFSISKVGPLHEVSDSQDGSRIRFKATEGFLLQPHFGATEDLGDFMGARMIVPMLQQHLQEALRKTLYLGPFRQSPLRRYPTRGASPGDVGAQGEAAVIMLANEMIESTDRPHLKRVGEWLELLGLGKKVELERLGASDLFGLNVTLPDGTAFPVADLGYGMSQILPVLVQCSFAEEGSTLLFEQPEIHLHTRSAKPLADVFAQTAERGVGLVVETHSPQLVWAVVNAVRDGKVDAKDVALYRVRRIDGRSQVEELILEKDLDIYSNWESDIS